MNEPQASGWKTLYLRVRPELHDQVKALAERDHRTINATSEILLMEALNARKEKQA
jgi:hypothetical protein